MTIRDELRIVDVVMDELVCLIGFLCDFIEVNQFLFVLIVELDFVAVHKLASQANCIADRCAVKNTSDVLLKFLFLMSSDRFPL